MGKKDNIAEGKKPDKRFKKDARFRNVHKQKREKLDPRFAKALKSDLFKDEATLDKYGRVIEDDQLKMLKDQYEFGDDELEKLDAAIDEEDNENGQEEVDVQMEEGVEEDFNEQESIPRGEATKRIAILNCDWESTSAQDLYALVSSCVPSSGKLERVSIYPSKFGMEKMQQEEVEGMPKSLWKDEVQDLVEVIEDKKLTDPDYIPVFTVASDDKLEEENPELAVNEEEIEAVEEEDNDEDLGLRPVTKEDKTTSKAEKVITDFLDEDKVREYEREKLKYYFAVAEFDSIETANAVYEAIDGEEMEYTQDSFDLRFVTDDTEFPYAPVDTCDKLTRVIGKNGTIKSSKVRVTWDTNERKRVAALNKSWNDMKEDDILNDEEAYKEYMEHSSDYEDEEGETPERQNEKDVEDIRKKYAILLGEQINEGEQDNDGEMMMTYTTEGVKEPKKDTKKQKEEEEKRKEELELLMMDDINEVQEKKMKRRLDETEDEQEEKKKKKFKKKETKKSKKEKMDKDFRIDTEDPRFSKMFNSHDFEIDPSNPEYVDTRGMKQLLKEKHKKFEKRMKEHSK